MLIAILFLLNNAASDRARAAEEKDTAIRLAQQQYESDIKVYDNAVADREACIGRVDARQNNIDNWHSQFDSFRAFADYLGSDALRQYADAAQLEFDSKPNNQPLTVELDCASYPIPNPVEIPPVLVEEGIVGE